MWAGSPKHTSDKARGGRICLKHESIGCSFGNRVRIEMLGRYMRRWLQLVIEAMPLDTHWSSLVDAPYVQVLRADDDGGR